MAESPAVAAERDVLLATKLHMPASRPGQVRRPRLTARLDEGAARGLVLVCAPAGYGKTVLLADWARRGEHPAGWLSLDAGDNDPARFWRHAVAALDRARPGIGDRVAPLLGPPAPASFQGLVTALINDLAGEEALLVLDDYHVIGSQQVHESLAFLLEHRSAGLRVALASRSDPPLGLARLRVRGQLTEIREAELRFTPAEAAELLQHMAAPGACPGRRCLRGRRGACGPDRGLGGGPAAGRAVTARPGRCRRVRGRVHRQPPVRAGLPGRGGARGPARAAARLPAGDVGAGAAQRSVVQRGHRPAGQPGAAGGGRTGGTVPGPAG